MDIQRFEIENITKSGFACVRDILTDRLLVTSDSCDLLNEQYQKILDLQSQLDHQETMWNELKEWVSFTQPKNINDEFISGVCSAYSNVIDKMQELEKGGNNEN